MSRHLNLHEKAWGTPPPPPSPDEYEMDRDMEYFMEPDELPVGRDRDLDE